MWDNNNDDDDAGDLEGLVDNGSSALALTTGCGGSPMRPRALGYDGGEGTAHLSYEELCRVHVDAFVQVCLSAPCLEGLSRMFRLGQLVEQLGSALTTALCFPTIVKEK